MEGLYAQISTKTLQFIFYITICLLPFIQFAIIHNLLPCKEYKFVGCLLLNKFDQYSSVSTKCLSKKNSQNSGAAV